MNVNDRYRELSGNKFSQLNISPEAYVPKPDEKDYERGYITRYFVQKVNDYNAPIFEVSDIEFARLTNVVTFNTTSLRWRLTGPISRVFNGHGKVTDMGIRESNMASIKIESDQIPNLKLYLPNLIQFLQK